MQKRHLWNISLFFICIFLIFTTEGSTENCCKSSDFLPCEKTYVSPEQIFFSANNICITWKDQSITTSAIHSDAQGLFFKDFRKQGVCNDGYWECQVCHHCTPYWKNFCEVCWH